MSRNIRLRRFAVWVVIAAMILNVFAMGSPTYADTAIDLDLSGLSTMDEAKTETKETYSYTWTVEDKDGETVRTLHLTLNGANINTLTLPCRSSGEIHVEIETVSDSHVVEIVESYVFSYSHQWNTITFSGNGNLSIGRMATQGAGNDHVITIAEGADVNIIGDEMYGLNFGASASNNSTLSVKGHLSVKGMILCGHAEIGPAGALVAEGMQLVGRGAKDEDGAKDAFILQPGGKLELTGNPEWIDEETGNPCAPFMVQLTTEDTFSAEEIVNLPEGALPTGTSIYKSEESGFVTFDDGEENPKLAGDGIIYGLSPVILPATYTVEWKNEDGTILETDESLLYGAMPSYDGETPTKEADAFYTYTFAGWDEEIIPVKGNSVYYAVYSTSPITYEVSFDSNGGSKVLPQTVEAGQKATVPAEPVRDGFIFKGWSFEGESYDFESAVMSNVTLVAIWEEEPEAPKPPGKPGIPTKPEPPKKPESPAKPEPPEKPESPAKPEPPEKPESPAKPEPPEKPGTPAKPESLEKPESLTKPESPVESEKVITEEKPLEKAEKENSTEVSKSERAPQTGDENNFAAWMGMMMVSLIAGTMILFARQRKDKKN